MLDASWPQSLLILILAAGVLTCLALSGVVAMLLLRKIRGMRRQTEQRLDQLAQRVRLIELLTERPLAQPAPRESRNEAGRSLALAEVSDQASAGRDWTLIAVPNLGVDEPEVDPGAENDLSQRHGEVWSLAALGASTQEIARQTGQPIGQVEVIVGLYRRLHSSRGPHDHARSD